MAKIVGTGPTVEDVASDVYGYIFRIGSCHTGIAEVFYAFWYFGSLLFIFVGYVMRRLWEGAMGGYVFYQFLYMTGLVYMLGTYNGIFANFFLPWPHLLIFAGPFLWYARIRKGHDTDEYASSSYPPAVPGPWPIE